MAHRVVETCEGKCTGPPNRGVRSTWWCGYPQESNPLPHTEHDHLHKGQWYHCYG